MASAPGRSGASKSGVDRPFCGPLHSICASPGAGVLFMRKELQVAVRAVLGAGVALAAGPAAWGQEQRPELEEIVVVGTRTAGHDVYESLAPIDLVSSEAIR